MSFSWSGGRASVLATRGAELAAELGRGRPIRGGGAEVLDLKTVVDMLLVVASWCSRCVLRVRLARLEISLVARGVGSDVMRGGGYGLV